MLDLTHRLLYNVTLKSATATETATETASSTSTSTSCYQCETFQMFMRALFVTVCVSFFVCVNGCVCMCECVPGQTHPSISMEPSSLQVRRWQGGMPLFTPAFSSSPR